MDIQSFENKLKTLNLSKKDFANMSGLAYNSVVNWNAKNTTPCWVESYLDYYTKSKILDNFRESLKVYDKS